MSSYVERSSAGALNPGFGCVVNDLLLTSSSSPRARAWQLPHWLRFAAVRDDAASVLATPSTAIARKTEAMSASASVKPRALPAVLILAVSCFSSAVIARQIADKFLRLCLV